jgi:hypothetical protein
MKRRNFVLLVSVGIAAAAIPAAKYFFYAIPDYDKKLSYPHLLSQIMDEKTIMGMGAKYREQFPEESSERVLARTLFGDSDNLSQDKLEAMVRADFSEGRTVVIEGWVLSKTEARQCALHYLLNRKNA